MKSTSFLKFLSGSFSSRCLIFKVQFRCPLSRQLTEYITSSLPCQPLFLTFFKVFWGYLRASVSVISLSFPNSLTSRLAHLCTVFYHLLFPLSTPFSPFFSLFSHSSYTNPCVFAWAPDFYTIYCIFFLYRSLFPISCRCLSISNQIYDQ